MENKQEVYTDHEQRFFWDDNVKQNNMTTEEEIRLMKRLEQSFRSGIITFTDMMTEYKYFVIKQYNEQVKRNNKTKY